MSKHYARAVVGALAALLAVGCGGGPDDASGTTSSSSTHGASSGSTGSSASSSSSSSTAGSSGSSSSSSSSSSGSSTGSPGSTSSSSGSTGSTASSSSSGSTGSTASSSSSGTSGSTASSSSGGTTGSSGGATTPYVFTIALENEARSDIYGNSSAPYLNGLMDQYGHAANYQEVLGLEVESEPHYVWMEAGTNALSDHTFDSDDDPSRTNSTSSTAHLVTQLQNAGRSWRVYMEDIDGSSGACPIYSNGAFAAWHNPVIWFHDVSGSPPSANNAFCAAHHRNYGDRFIDDLNSGDVANYTFITPNLCHDMHGASGCGNSDDIRAGDTWLSENLPAIIDFVNAHGGVIFLIWDETSATNQWGDPVMPFLVIGPNIKTGYASPQEESHSSYLKTVEELMGVPVMSNVQGANDLSNYWNPGTFPANPPAP